MKRRSGFAPWVAVVVLTAGAVLGGLLGPRVLAEADWAPSQLRTFGRVLALVEDTYVGKADANQLVTHALQGMLRELDPHSNYLDRDGYSEMKDEQRGEFFGLGIQINKRGPDKPLTIIAPIEETPAARAGLQPGDVIFKIEGEETIRMPIQEAVRKLKGEKGTKVTITIQRPGEDRPFDIAIVRDRIPTHSLHVAYMLSPEVGFVRISNFVSTTAQELDQALERLGRQGMTQLILDLRSNPGGLLDQAVAVAERFLPQGKLIVYTKGRVPGSDQNYVSSSDVRRTSLPLVVLVDHHSASASEIVSGAIQDHDRGLVVGETTFGKGLVQRVIPLRDGGALALTTAKYYTPSGRLIQRDFSDLDDYFLEEEDEEETAGPDTPEPAKGQREVRHTDSGRIVYGGGGIMPDHIVRRERPSRLVLRIQRDNLPFDFAVRYAAAHPGLKPDARDLPGLLDEFREHLRSRGFAYEEAAFETSRGDLERFLRAQVTRIKWGQEAESRVLAQSDPQVQKALTLFEEAQRLAEAGERASRKGNSGNSGTATETPSGS